MKQLFTHAWTAGQFASYVNVVSEAIELQTVCRSRASHDYSQKNVASTGQYAHCVACSALDSTCKVLSVTNLDYEMTFTTVGTMPRLLSQVKFQYPCPLCMELHTFAGYNYQSDVHCRCKAHKVRVDGIQMCGQAMGHESQCNSAGCHIIHGSLV